jgi:tripartite-type tricarboxylate transporter receptor subunit TctC
MRSSVLHWWEERRIMDDEHRAGSEVPTPARSLGRRTAIVALAGVTAAGITLGRGAPAAAQSYPSQTVRIIVPFGPGGGVDIIARTIADEWTKQHGHSVLVENRAGAGGNIGSAAAARSAPDGHTLLLASNSNSYNDLLYSNAGYSPPDLVPVIQIGRVPTLLVASPTLAVTNVKELVEMAKSRPGSLSFASFGFGSSGHLLYEMFTRRTGIEAVHVPYRNGQTYPDLIAGRIHAMFNNQLGVMSHIRSGQMRALGVAANERSPQLPDVQTFAEQGIPDFSTDVWWGIMAPSGTPASIVARTNEIVNGVLAAPDVRNRLQALGASPVGGEPSRFATFFTSERATWQRVINEANIRVD